MAPSPSLCHAACVLPPLPPPRRRLHATITPSNSRGWSGVQAKASPSPTARNTSALTSKPTTNLRLSLMLALSVRGAVQSERVVQSFIAEARKFLNFREGQPRSIEEALMTVPNLETIPFRVVRKGDMYDVREYESYLVAETEMAGQSAFGFFASSRAFNTIASYIFGQNTKRVEMAMTTPVLIQIDQKKEESMEMTTPVLSQKKSMGGPWTMAFVLPSKYSEDNFPLPKDPSVVVRRIPSKLVAAVTFSGYVSDKEIERRERSLRLALQNDALFQVKDLASVQVAQYNPPFVPPFMRCNEILLEVRSRDSSSI